MAELGNLAIVLRFGMNLEEAVADYYEKLATDERFSAHKEALDEFASESRELKADLEKKYRDCNRSDMDMGALEPVSGIDTENYEQDLDFAEDKDIPALVSAAVEAEEKLSKFYRDIGRKVDYLAEREMERIAERKEVRKTEIQKMLG